VFQPLQFGDVDTFERQHKPLLVLIIADTHIADYLNSTQWLHGCSDDLGQLDTASQAIHTGGRARLASGSRTTPSPNLHEGFGDQPIDTRRFYQGFVSDDIDWAYTPLDSKRLQLGLLRSSGPWRDRMEGLSRVTPVCSTWLRWMSAIFGKRCRDLTAMAEMAMMRGISC